MQPLVRVYFLPLTGNGFSQSRVVVCDPPPQLFHSASNIILAPAFSQRLYLVKPIHQGGYKFCIPSCNRNQWLQFGNVDLGGVKPQVVFLNDVGGITHRFGNLYKRERPLPQAQGYKSVAG